MLALRADPVVLQPLLGEREKLQRLVGIHADRVTRDLPHHDPIPIGDDVEYLGPREERSTQLEPVIGDGGLGSRSVGFCRLPPSLSLHQLLIEKPCEE